MCFKTVTWFYRQKKTKKKQLGLIDIFIVLCNVDPNHYLSVSLELKVTIRCSASIKGHALIDLQSLQGHNATGHVQETTGFYSIQHPLC